MIIDPWGGPPPTEQPTETPDGFTDADLARLRQAVAEGREITCTWPAQPLYDADGQPLAMTQPTTTIWHPTTIGETK